MEGLRNGHLFGAAEELGRFPGPCAPKSMMVQQLSAKTYFAFLPPCTMPLPSPVQGLTAHYS
jgi:hypothetical protein